MTVQRDRTDSVYDRRGFLGRVGAGAGVVALAGGAAGGLARPVSAAPARSLFVETDASHFGRIFPGLEPFAPANKGVTKSLILRSRQSHHEAHTAPRLRLRYDR